MVAKLRVIALGVKESGCDSWDDLHLDARVPVDRKACRISAGSGSCPTVVKNISKDAMGLVSNPIGGTHSDEQA